MEHSNQRLQIQRTALKLASNSVTQASATVDPLATVSLSVFPALASVIAEAASVSARPLILTHMSKAAPVTLVTPLYVYIPPKVGNAGFALACGLVSQGRCRMNGCLFE